LANIWVLQRDQLLRWITGLQLEKYMVTTHNPLDLWLATKNQARHTQKETKSRKKTSQAKRLKKTAKEEEKQTIETKLPTVLLMQCLGMLNCSDRDQFATLSLVNSYFFSVISAETFWSHVGSVQLSPSLLKQKILLHRMKRARQVHFGILFQDFQWNGSHKKYKWYDVLKEIAPHVTHLTVDVASDKVTWEAFDQLFNDDVIHWNRVSSLTLNYFSPYLRALRCIMCMSSNLTELYFAYPALTRDDHVEYSSLFNVAHLKKLHTLQFSVNQPSSYLNWTVATPSSWFIKLLQSCPITSLSLISVDSGAYHRDFCSLDLLLSACTKSNLSTLKYDGFNPDSNVLMDIQHKFKSLQIPYRAMICLGLTNNQTCLQQLRTLQLKNFADMYYEPPSLPMLTDLHLQFVIQKTTELAITFPLLPNWLSSLTGLQRLCFSTLNSLTLIPLTLSNVKYKKQIFKTLNILSVSNDLRHLDVDVNWIEPQTVLPHNLRHLYVQLPAQINTKLAEQMKSIPSIDVRFRGPLPKVNSSDDDDDDETKTTINGVEESLEQKSETPSFCQSVTLVSTSFPGDKIMEKWLDSLMGPITQHVTLESFYFSKSSQEWNVFKSLLSKCPKLSSFTFRGRSAPDFGVLRVNWPIVSFVSDDNDKTSQLVYKHRPSSDSDAKDSNDDTFIVSTDDDDDSD
jgi:hypothetical protein